MPPRTGSSTTGETMLIGGRFTVRQRNEAELQEVGAATFARVACDVKMNLIFNQLVAQFLLNNKVKNSFLQRGCSRQSMTFEILLDKYI